MNISSNDLRSQFEQVRRDFPFIDEINDRAGFPKCLLHAVASRETNMTNEIGDGGHGHGMFQLDDRWHQIPDGFDNDVQAQANRAASMLAGLHAAYGNWLSALNAYNSGSPDTARTAGGDYGPDVLERQALLAGPASAVNPPVIEAMTYGQRSDAVLKLQQFLNKTFPLYSHIAPQTGYYGDQTAAVLAEFQRRSGIIGGDGRNVGPRTAAALSRAGFRP